MDTCIAIKASDIDVQPAREWFPGFDGDAQAWEQVIVPWPSAADVDRLLRTREHGRSLAGRLNAMCTRAVDVVRYSMARAHA